MRSSLGSDEERAAKVQPSCATTDAVPAACPIGQHNGVIHGHSRVHGHTARPAFELTDTPGLEAFQAGHAGSIPVARSKSLPGTRRCGLGWQLVPGEAAAHGDDHGSVGDGPGAWRTATRPRACERTRLAEAIRSHPSAESSA
jgi:hypothetical protein